MSLCGVCGTGVSKYKCPGCVLAYCSVPCYRAHCTSCVHSGKRAESSTGAAAAPPQPTTGTLEDEFDDCEDTLSAKLPEALLQAMSRDPRVVSALGSSRLRKALLAIDQAPDRVLALESFKRSEGAPFRDFLDDVLLALGVAVRGEGGGVEFTGKVAPTR